MKCVSAVFMWRIQDFPDGDGCQPIFPANFSRELHENEEIEPIGGVRGMLPLPWIRQKIDLLSQLTG